MNLATLHDQLKPILIEAEAILATKFGTEIEQSYKPDQVSQIAIVTEVDRAVDDLLRTRLAALFPEIGFITEEGEVGSPTEYMWVIDPLDGTMNYSRGLPFFALSLALWRGNQPVYGSISLPIFNQRMHGYQGGGVWVNDQPLVLPTREVPPKPYVMLGDASKPEELAKIAFALANSVNAHHDFGSCVFQAFQLIMGKADLAAYYHVALWDIGAAVLLAQEAGLAIKWISPEPDLSVVDPKGYSHTLVMGLPPVAEKAAVALTGIMES